MPISDAQEVFLLDQAGEACRDIHVAQARGDEAAVLEILDSLDFVMLRLVFLLSLEISEVEVD